MSGPPGRLLHLGNVVIDVVLAVPALPERGGDVLASAVATAPGGGFNVLAAAARHGLPAAYAGVIGSGPFADLALAALAAERVEVLRPPKAGGDTGLVISLTDAGGERTFVTSPGAEATLTAADLAPVRATPRDAVYLSGYGLAHPANRAALLGWLPGLPGSSLLVFDPGPLADRIPAAALDAVLRRADWLTCNEREASRLAGGGDPAGLIQRIRAAGPGRPAGVVIRTGPGGCLLLRPGERPEHIPGFRVRAVDTSGAGDTHAGVFIAELARGAAPAAASRSANAAAAISVTRRGPATSPTAAQLARFLAGAG